jgi:plastocyanin
MKFGRGALAWMVLAAGTAAVVALGCSSNKGGNPMNPGPGGGPTFSSGRLRNAGDVFVFTFTQDGSWNYHCGLHGTAMSGTVVVSAAGQDSPVVNVGVGGNFFNPSSVNVKNGGYVKWVWSTGVHTVVR